MVAWIVWLIVAAVLGVAELVTFTFALGLIAVGACVAAAVAALQLGLPFQLLAFVIASVAGLGLVLPIARRHVRQPPLLKTGPAALVGRPARYSKRSPTTAAGSASAARSGQPVPTTRRWSSLLAAPSTSCRSRTRTNPVTGFL